MVFNVQSGYIGCNTGNGKKLSSSQAQQGQGTCLADALFLSISCVTSYVAALYVVARCISVFKFGGIVQPLVRPVKRQPINSCTRRRFRHNSPNLTVSVSLVARQLLKQLIPATINQKHLPTAHALNRATFASRALLTFGFMSY